MVDAPAPPGRDRSANLDVQAGSCPDDTVSIGLGSRLELPLTPGKWYAAHIGSYHAPLEPVSNSTHVSSGYPRLEYKRMSQAGAPY